MAYDENEPTPNKRGKDTRQQILDNFAEIQTFLAVNHEDFGSPNQGKHKWLSLQDQGAVPPANSFAGNEVGLFASTPQEQPFTGQNELFVRRATGRTTPWTAGETSTAAQMDADVDNWCILPNGMIVKWANKAFTAALAPIDSNETVYNLTYVWNAGNTKPRFGQAPFAVYLSVQQLGTVGSSLSTRTFVSLRPDETTRDQVAFVLFRFFDTQPLRAGQVSIIAIGR